MDFDSSLKIYKFNFFPNNEMILFVKSCYDKPRNMIVTIPDKTIFSKEIICESIKNRVPIYFGKPIKQMYNYDYNAILDYEQPYGMRYAICGKAYLMNNKYFYAIHTWGVNLESYNTTDYKHIVKNNKINLKKYTEETRKMIECIIKAKNHYNLDEVYLPLIGLGTYLSAVFSEEKVKAIKIFFSEISKTDLIVIIISKDQIPIQIYETYHSSIQVGNLFTPRNGKYGIVNAWDSNSFIGNGGSKDPTIDGWFVAGYGPNKDLKNSSFLHNPIFNPNICIIS